METRPHRRLSASASLETGRFNSRGPRWPPHQGTSLLQPPPSKRQTKSLPASPTLNRGEGLPKSFSFSKLLQSCQPRRRQSQTVLPLTDCPPQRQDTVTRRHTEGDFYVRSFMLIYDFIESASGDKVDVISGKKNTRLRDTITASLAVRGLNHSMIEVRADFEETPLSMDCSCKNLYGKQLFVSYKRNPRTICKREGLHRKKNSR